MIIENRPHVLSVVKTYNSPRKIKCGKQLIAIGDSFINSFRYFNCSHVFKFKGVSMKSITDTKRKAYNIGGTIKYDKISYSNAVNQITNYYKGDNIFVFYFGQVDTNFTVFYKGLHTDTGLVEIKTDEDVKRIKNEMIQYICDNATQYVNFIKSLQCKSKYILSIFPNVLDRCFVKKFVVYKTFTEEELNKINTNQMYMKIVNKEFQEEIRNAANNKMKELCSNNDITFVDCDNVFKNNTDIIVKESICNIHPYEEDVVPLLKASIEKYAKNLKMPEHMDDEQMQLEKQKYMDAKKKEVEKVAKERTI